MNLTRKDKAKVEEILSSLYSGVVMSLTDPVSDEYKRVNKRLTEELKELRIALGLELN
jgi:hypothetical protein